MLFLVGKGKTSYPQLMNLFEFHVTFQGFFNVYKRFHVYIYTYIIYYNHMNHMY